MNKPFTTLIIDHNTAVRQRIRDMVKKFSGDETVLSATDYPEAIDLVNRCSPGVVILDLHLPGGSGIDLIAMLKKAAPACRVIVFTNSIDPVYKSCCMEYGADHFFDKSLEIGRLLEIVEELHANTH